jgi:ribosomal protein L11 methyltransferase
MRFDRYFQLLTLGAIARVSYSFNLVSWRQASRSFATSRTEVALHSVEDSIMNVAGAPLKQLQIRFNCDDVDSDDISELLFEVGTLSVSVEVESEKDILNDQSKWVDLIKTKSWDTALLRANFPSSFNSEGLTDILEVAFPDVKFEFVVVDVEDKDWVSDVQKTWLPQIIGNLTIRFPWHIKEERTEDADENKKNLVLEGGAAFGTGDHPTTRLCCRWLEREIRADVGSQKLSVLDYGCGSAILGLAALRYGAAKAVGVDIDKDAIVSATNNCLINDLEMDFYLADDDDDHTDEERSVVNNILKGYQVNSFAPASDLEKEGPVFDLLVANILAPILIHLAPTLASHLKPGGRIALSGLVLRQAETVIEKYQELFDDVKLEQSEDDWALVTGVKR